MPPEKPVGPEGGHPQIDNYTVLRVIWYVLSTGIRWRDVPPDMGCSGETARTRLRNGVPLAVRMAGANRSDQREILPIIQEGFPEVGGQPGRPITRPDEVYADAGYDSETTGEVRRCLGIEPLIRKRGEEHGSGLGRVRRVVERSLAWLQGLRRLRCRYDRSEQIIHGRPTLAMSVIKLRLWHNEIQLASK